LEVEFTDELVELGDPPTTGKDELVELVSLAGLVELVSLAGLVELVSFAGLVLLVELLEFPEGTTMGTD
jgi:hypothetical protein